MVYRNERFQGEVDEVLEQAADYLTLNQIPAEDIALLDFELSPFTANVATVVLIYRVSEQAPLPLAQQATAVREGVN